ncbi:amidohydrolase family protein [Thalassotalea piscium]|uniref:Imidazolonepropionase-like amidohydrolase n=1 Tax=Thalassotalea piscium TaxID=1230533 RepID=A0A7X0NEZ3_9GAMM|nr:amidohydrolase family protein [Thalassotalea piscium]MBB6542223.1 imidazolonepropionase-like amidohydrolase [Thalassotalea piscium]
MKLLKNNKLKISAALTLMALAVNAWADTKVIHAGELLTVPGSKALSKQTLVIKDGKILQVKSGFINPKEIAEDATLIDLSSSFVMPGLMDMHVHLQGELGPRNDSETLKMSSQLMQMRSHMFAMRTLNAGFTTVRDVGSSPQEMYAMRDAIDNGWMQGPTIIAAGGVGITGGHADVSGVSPELMEFHDESNKTICNGPFDCRRAARHSIKYGADLIKITSTGGVLTDRATGTGQQMEMDELKEVVLAAKRMGSKVASHAHQEDGIIAALEAGVASIEHGTYAGKKAYKLFKETGAYLVPTLLAGETVLQMAKNTNVLSESQKVKAIKVGTDMKGNFAKAYKAGVKIAFGTDSGVSQHGTNAQEAVLMFNAGMPAADIIKSATVNAADLIDRSSSLGTLEVGKMADIIATHGSPLNNIEELLDVDFVMKAGEVIKSK